MSAGGGEERGRRLGRAPGVRTRSSDTRGSAGQTRIAKRETHRMRSSRRRCRASMLSKQGERTTCTASACAGPRRRVRGAGRRR
eukprot:3937360-Rhodomonas_salina.1